MMKYGYLKKNLFRVFVEVIYVKLLIFYVLNLVSKRYVSNCCYYNNMFFFFNSFCLYKQYIQLCYREMFIIGCFDVDFGSYIGGMWLVILIYYIF